MSVRRAWIAAVLTALGAVVTGGWLLRQTAIGARVAVRREEALLHMVHDTLAAHYVDPVDPAHLYELAIDGMLARIGDPYAAYLRPEQREDAVLSNSYGGVGLRVLTGKRGISVLRVIPHSPSARMGLRREDLIVAIDGQPAGGWTQSKAIKTLRGPRGSAVALVVRRAGLSAPLRVRLVRDRVHIVAVTAFMLDTDVGYARLDQFSRSAREELQAAMDDLIAAGARGVVLDLRFNPGGLLREGVAVSDLFLPRGVKVVETRASDRRDDEVMRAPNPDHYPELPLVLLVNRFSASASEIVAGALQDHDRALLVGTPTFGKGVMQSIFPLQGGGFLRLTTGTWFTPSGRSIHQRRVMDLAAGALGRTPAAEPPGDRWMDGVPQPFHGPVRIDTAGRRLFYTDAGRPVYGGGGVTPDLIVKDDSLVGADRVLREDLLTAGGSFFGAAFRFGLEWRRSHPGLREDFEVTPNMRDAFYDFLSRESHAPLDRGHWEAGRALVDYVLGVQLASMFGEEPRLRRRLRRSRQVHMAIRLLHQVGTPECLFARAREVEGPFAAAWATTKLARSTAPPVEDSFSCHLSSERPVG